jgi:predicted DsbA family dithiol-disulfide isomerase
MRDEVISESKRWASKHGIRGVPFFVINDRVRLSGAQDTEVFADVFREIIGLSADPDA